MMMAELPFGFCMILGGKSTRLGAPCLKRIDERPISMIMAEPPFGFSMTMGMKATLEHLQSIAFQFEAERISRKREETLAISA